MSVNLFGHGLVTAVCESISYEIFDILKKKVKLSFRSYNICITNPKAHVFTIVKGACSDPQPHPPNFFQTCGDFGTES